MKTLVIGAGGREHALIKALSADVKEGCLFLLPGRPGIREARPLPGELLQDYASLLQAIQKEGIELVVIGPEKPLTEGLADFLRAEGLLVFGPSKRLARLEGSKIFAKKFMKAQGIPTASWRAVSNVAETLHASENFSPPFVLKADGLAGGKGVFICKSAKELEERARLIFERQIFGPQKALLEDFQTGSEISLFLLASGAGCSIFPLARDYKRLLAGGKGPNTGGMGAVAPVAPPEGFLEAVKASVIEPTLKGIQEMGEDYRGVLYIGLMWSAKGPKVLEYNVRFGDPEAQALLPLLDGSWLKVFESAARGGKPRLKWKKGQTAVCLVMACAPYPEKPSHGAAIEGFLFRKTPHSFFLQAGVGRNDKGQWVTAGGRALNAVGLGASAPEARRRAYEQAKAASWPGMILREDIGEDLA